MKTPVVQNADQVWTVSVSGDPAARQRLLNDPQGQPLQGWDRTQLALAHATGLQLR